MFWKRYMGTSAGRPWDQYLLTGWVVMKSMSVYHLVDHELKVETFFWKEGPSESGEVDLETSAQVPWRLKKVSCRVFILSFGILVARNSFQSSEFGSRKRYTLKLLLMYLEAMQEEFSCFSGRDWLVGG